MILGLYAEAQDEESITEDKGSMAEGVN